MAVVHVSLHFLTVVLLLGACYSLRFPQEEDEEGPEYPCSQLPGVLVCGANHSGPVWVGEGATAHMYYGQDAEDISVDPRWVIVKVFKGFEPATFMQREFLDTDLGKEVWQDAKGECEVGQQALDKAQSGELREAQRLRGCYGHNFGRRTKSWSRGQGRKDILYLKLMDAGSTTLLDFVDRQLANGEWNGITLVKFFKMILEAFKAMHKLQWVMHDFHSGNVMVKKNRGNATLMLIDFGYSVRATEACGRDDLCSEWYAPPEYEGDGFQPKAPCGTPAFDPAFPGAFDMYGAGVWLFELLAVRGHQAFDSWKRFEAEARIRWNLRPHQEDSRSRRPYHLRKFVADRFVSMLFDKKMQRMWDQAPRRHRKYDGLSVVAQEVINMEHSSGFLRMCAKLLSINPKDRPTAVELLEHPFMKRVRVPDDPDVRR